jgi:hypothetical protein
VLVFNQVRRGGLQGGVTLPSGNTDSSASHGPQMKWGLLLGTTPDKVQFSIFKIKFKFILQVGHPSKCWSRPAALTFSDHHNWCFASDKTVTFLVIFSAIQI